MASIFKGRLGQPIQFETKPNVNGDDVATEQFVLDNSLGIGQTWQDVTASRSAGVTYTNATGRPIYVSIALLDGGSTSSWSYDIDGITTYMGNPNGGATEVSFIVPDGVTYGNLSIGSNTISMWKELR